VKAIPVTELKQWGYCGRIVYYHRVLGGVGRPTYKMGEAVRAQETIERLEMRRALGEYGFEGARRRFGVWLEDEGVGLSGKIDLLLEREDEAAVVDFKLTSGEPGENHRYQLAGYAVLVEAALKVAVGRAFLYRIPDDRIFEIDVGAEARGRVAEAVRSIREVEEREIFPEATRVRGRCVDCEYANYCGDVW
jgi:CRISPR-associated exonuclease Cas4